VQYLVLQPPRQPCQNSSSPPQAIGQGSRFSPQYEENELVDGLGEDWRGIDGIRVKKYNSMEGTPAPIDCIATLQGKYPERFADLSSIRKITIKQAEAFFAHGGHEV